MMHQRMGFYVAPDGRLLALAFYGQSPNPFGMGGVGRVVREAYRDGTYTHDGRTVEKWVAIQ